MKMIKNATILNSEKNQVVTATILFDEKIRQISEQNIEREVESMIDLQGKLLIPGCIDAHVHFNDPGYTHHEDFLSGTRSAAAGGITTVIDMPCTSIPAVTRVESLQQKLAVIEPKAVIDFALWAGLPDNEFPLDKEKIYKLWKAGVVGFKIYTISGMDTFKALTYDQIQEVFAKLPQLLFAFHAEDPEVIYQAENSFSSLAKSKPEIYPLTRPAAAEIAAVTKILSSVGPENKLHIVHVGSKDAAKEIIKAKETFDVSWETCPHYLQFIADDFFSLKGKLKTAPPVKNAADREFLRNCLLNDKLDFVATDHAGCDWETEKDLEDFSQVYNGIPGTQLMIPYLFSEFYYSELVDLRRMIEITSENAAKRYGLFPQKGSLQIDTDADFTIIDLKRSLQVDEQKLLCLGKYSPLHGKILDCSIDKTFVRGNLVYDSHKGVTGQPGWGKWIKRKD